MKARPVQTRALNLGGGVMPSAPPLPLRGCRRGLRAVHCFAGLSRSASLVCAYLMRENRWTYEQSLDFVRAARPARGRANLLGRYGMHAGSWMRMFC